MLLERALTTMAGLQIPTGCAWELVAVDNGSTDDTPMVLAAFRDRLPLQIVREPALGLARARNAGIARRGELVLFTDDDVIVDTDRLAAYVAGAARWPAAAYVGGQIDPRFEQPPRRWLTHNRAALKPMLAAVDLDRRERPIEDSEQPFGPNMVCGLTRPSALHYARRIARRLPCAPQPALTTT